MASSSASRNTQARSSLLCSIFLFLIHQISTSSAFINPFPTSTFATMPSTSSTLSFQRSILQHRRHGVIYSSTEDNGERSMPTPQTFREAEILGLRLMQEGNHEQALEVFQKGLKLPGSRKDIIRTQKISGPSPVGGSSGGTEGRVKYSLDEFELQAAHYNIACALARLGRVAESCQNLEKAFQSGFDNYNTVRVDPDLSDVHSSLEFETLMEKWDPKKGFFGFFKK